MGGVPTGAVPNDRAFCLPHNASPLVTELNGGRSDVSDLSRINEAYVATAKVGSSPLQGRVEAAARLMQLSVGAELRDRGFNVSLHAES